MRVGGQRHAPATLPPVPIVQGGAPGPVWTGAENLASTGIRSPDRPARSDSLYRLSYPGTQVLQQKTKHTEDEPIDIPEGSRTPLETTNSVISHAL
jgi:hypothetical protein